MVCDVRGTLMTVETNWPGSLQDCVVLQQSSLSSQFEAGMHKESWLLGKSASVNASFYIYGKLIREFPLWLSRNEPN